MHYRFAYKILVRATHWSLWFGSTLRRFSLPTCPVINIRRIFGFFGKIMRHLYNLCFSVFNLLTFLLYVIQPNRHLYRLMYRESHLLHKQNWKMSQTEIGLIFSTSSLKTSLLCFSIYVKSKSKLEFLIIRNICFRPKIVNKSINCSALYTGPILFYLTSLMDIWQVQLKKTHARKLSGCNSEEQIKNL